jgi:dienelactone hydrolase
MRHASLAIAALCALILSSAQLPVRADEPELPLGKRLEEFAKLQQQLIPRFAAKDWEKIAEICRKQMTLVPESPEPHYNLACTAARLGHKDEALLELGLAVELGFTDATHMREDDDLTTLREDEKFKELVKQAHDKLMNAPHEAAGNIAGVKTVEGFPDQGLRFRMRIDPAATAQKPARLLIWLHPSGGSMDNVVEQMSPQFAKDGFALLVFTQKNYNFWTPADAAALMLKTLPEVAKIPGVDAKRPILIGFSAGGQLALQLWQKNPANFGGMVLDAAYPLDPQRFAQRQVAPLPLPTSDAIQKCPVLTLVGGNDGGSKLWQAVEKSWRDAKIPLTIHIIPGKAHAWLVDKTEEASLHAWLKRVAAGELPSEATVAPAPGPQGDKVGPSIKI